MSCFQTCTTETKNNHQAQKIGIQKCPRKTNFNPFRYCATNT